MSKAQDRGPRLDRATATLEWWVQRLWDDEDACAEWFMDCWHDGVGVNWNLADRTARSLGVVLASDILNTTDDLPKGYWRHLEGIDMYG